MTVFRALLPGDNEAHEIDWSKRAPSGTTLVNVEWSFEPAGVIDITDDAENDFKSQANIRYIGRGIALVLATAEFSDGSTATEPLTVRCS